MRMKMVTPILQPDYFQNRFVVVVQAWPLVSFSQVVLFVAMKEFAIVASAKPTSLLFVADLLRLVIGAGLLWTISGMLKKPLAAGAVGRWLGQDVPEHIDP